MIHTLEKPSFTGAKYASVLSHNMKTQDHMISVILPPPKSLIKEPEPFKKKVLTSEEKAFLDSNIINIEDPICMSALSKQWWNFAKNTNHWIAVSNDYADLNENGVKRLYYNLIDNGMITRGIKRAVFNEMFETLLFEYLLVWAVQDQKQKKRKRNLITSKIQNWILTKIYETKQIRGTKLLSLCFRELEYKTILSAQKALNNSLKSLSTSGVIDVEEFKEHKYYKLKNVEFNNDEFLRSEK